MGMHEVQSLYELEFKQGFIGDSKQSCWLMRVSAQRASTVIQFS